MEVVATNQAEHFKPLTKIKIKTRTRFSNKSDSHYFVEVFLTDSCSQYLEYHNIALEKDLMLDCIWNVQRMVAVNLFKCFIQPPVEFWAKIKLVTFYNRVRKTWNNNLVEVVEYYFPDLRLIAIGPLIYFTDIALSLPLNWPPFNWPIDLEKPIGFV